MIQILFNVCTKLILPLFKLLNDVGAFKLPTIFPKVFDVRVVLFLEERLDFVKGLVCFGLLLLLNHIIHIKIIADLHLKNGLDDHVCIGTWNLPF